MPACLATCALRACLLLPACLPVPALCLCLWPFFLFATHTHIPLHTCMLFYACLYIVLSYMPCIHMPFAFYATTMGQDRDGWTVID